MKSLALFLTAALMAVPAPAADPSPNADPDQKIVCKGKREKIFGSNTAGRGECKTAGEWKRIEEESRRQLQHLRDNATDPGRISTDRSPN